MDSGKNTPKTTPTNNASSKSKLTNDVQKKSTTTPKKESNDLPAENKSSSKDHKNSSKVSSSPTRTKSSNGSSYKNDQNLANPLPAIASVFSTRRSPYTFIALALLVLLVAVSINSYYYRSNSKSSPSPRHTRGDSSRFSKTQYKKNDNTKRGSPQSRDKPSTYNKPGSSKPQGGKPPVKSQARSRPPPPPPKKKPIRIERLSVDLPSHLKRIWTPHSKSFVDTLRKCCKWTHVKDVNNATIIYAIDKLNNFKLRRHQVISGTFDATRNIYDDFYLHRSTMGNFTRSYDLSAHSDCVKFVNAVNHTSDLRWKIVNKFPGQNTEVIGNISSIAKNFSLPSTEEDCNSKDKDYIKFKYHLFKDLENKLLFESKRVMIRVYLLISSLRPYISFLHEGEVTLLSDEKKTYSVISFAQFTSLLLKSNKIDKTWKGEKFVPKLFEFCKQINRVLTSVIENRPPTNYNGLFEVLAIDFTLDDQFDLHYVKSVKSPKLNTLVNSSMS
eukprot:TRINITY_DN4473_c0_g1_i1.p1 TRINITY_DN4473_c0_g1~~TRINITY_DN4473_c0_g1_i1.p1  ORF type:complete len:499 (-),score=73.26 TRINITY_DN4473_c0_g1_i1:228-1724(-)